MDVDDNPNYGVYSDDYEEAAVEVQDANDYYEA